MVKATCVTKVRMAERSKAPDLSSGTRKCAWVRTPLLTNFFSTMQIFLNINFNNFT